MGARLVAGAVSRFVDRTTITVSSGSGGNGAISFRREKYVPRGGPDGGDGGRGGDILFAVRRNVHTLAHLAGRHHYRAENGASGSRRRRHGAAGKPLWIPVPPGTVVRDAASGQVLHDLTQPDQEWLCLVGGAGGAGNARFATSVRQAPRFATPGRPGREVLLQLELRSIADVGFVGFPNAGKSTLLAALTNARPRIAAYPFTTTIPQLGMMRLAAAGDARPEGQQAPPGRMSGTRAASPADTAQGEPPPAADWHEAQDVVLVDIPGILEGASTGVGLGLQFLDHIARVRLLAFVIDLTGTGDPAAALERELRAYDPALSERPRLVVGTKLDLDLDGALSTELRHRYPHEQVVTVSAHTGAGMSDLRAALSRLARTA